MTTHFQLLIVTGLSGAGKTQAMKALEDIGFFCIDNLPPRFLPQLTDLHGLAVDEGRRVAVAVDARNPSMFTDLFSALEELQAAGTPQQILFLDCGDDVLVRRFSESRRKHPLTMGASLFEQIAAERRLLAEVRDRADLVVDTSHIKPADLKARLARIFTGAPVERSMTIDVVSFGFKHGVPLDADLMLDVRFLPNPYYVDELREQTGLDLPVADYVLGQPDAGAWLHDTTTWLKRWMPGYGRSSRSSLTIAIGCTGGQHRSVALAVAMGSDLSSEFPNVTVRHRDMGGAAERRRTVVAQGA